MAYQFLEDGSKQPSEVSFGELDKRARIIAAFLQKKNIVGERILLLYPAGLDFITAFMGCLYAGAVAVPIAAPRGNDFIKWENQINAISDDAQIAGVLTAPTYFAKLNSMYSEKVSNNKLFITDTTLLEADDSIYRLPKINDETIAYLQYTSGSTSLPKGAIIRHKNLTHSLKQTMKAWHYTKNSVTLVWAPHSHVYGLICGLLVPLFHGTRSIIMPTDTFIRRPVSWLEAISKYKVTHSGCPNFGFDLCIREINDADLSTIDLSSWKVAINGGENVRDETINQFVQKFKICGFTLNQFSPAYGMSEISGAIAITRYTKSPISYHVATDSLKNHKVKITDVRSPHRTFVSSGRLLKGLSVKIVDPETLKALGKKEIGEIWLSGKPVIDGYWQCESENKELFRTLPGSNRLYFRTGDIGFFYRHELFVTGRLKEVVILNGKKYSPIDLEYPVMQALLNFPVGPTRVAFSAEIAGKEEVIFIQELNLETITIDMQEKIVNMIRHVMLEQHGIHLHDVVLVKMNTLPKTSSGKLQRKQCQIDYLQNKLQVLTTEDASENKHVNNSNDVGEVKLALKRTIAAVLKIDDSKVNLHAPLSQYGFDSINIIKLTTILNDKYHLTLTPAILFEYATLNEFMDDLLKDTFKQTNTKVEDPILHRSGEEDTLKNTLTVAGDIAIIGMSGQFPDATDVDQFWENLLQGKDCIREIPKDRWDWQAENKVSMKWGGFIEDIARFDATFFNISPREAEVTDPQQRLFLQTAWKAIEDAGYSTHALATMKTGLFVGVFNHDYAELLDKNSITDAYTTTGVTNCLLANRVSYLLNLQGPSEAIDTACSSSLVALHHAVLSIQNGDCEVAIVGGANALLSSNRYLAANNAGMLSEEGRCKTFDKSANGYVRAEGSVAIVLKSLNHAVRDNDHIYGVIKGTAVNHGGHVSSLTVPNPKAQAEVIATALRRAKISIDTINYIETHGTGTAIGDPIEINGLKKAFAQLAEEQHKTELPKHYCGLGAVKSNIGHLESAAGLAGVIKVLLALKHNRMPANLHFTELNPYIEIADSPFYVVNQTRSWERLTDQAGSLIPRRAGVSSFGFGGTNAHVVIEEYEQYQPIIEQNFPTLITLSAKTETALFQRVNDLYLWLNRQSTQPNLPALSYTLNVGRDHFDKRCILLVETTLELQQTLSLILKGEKSNNYLFNADKIDHTRIQAIYNETYHRLLKEITREESRDAYKKKLMAIGNFYTEGFEIDWERIHHGPKQRISLPTYPFAKDYYWIPNKEAILSSSLEVIAQDTELQVQELSQRIQLDFMQHVSELIKIPMGQINITAALSELGFDSITFKELAVRLEKSYGIELTPTLFFTHNNIKDLSQYLLDQYSDVIGKNIGTFVKSIKPIVSNETNPPINTVSTYEPIAIIGMHAYLPGSNNLQEFWQHLIAGDDLVSEIPINRWDWHTNYGDAKHDLTKTNSKWGACIADVDKFDAKFFNVSAREANLMDPQHRLFMEIVWKTIEDAGYDPAFFSGKDVGVFAGIEFSEYQNLIHAEKKIFHGHLATGTSHALLANRISYFLNLQGPSEVVDTACSSSSVAIHRAVNALRNGDCSVAIAGGVSLMLDPDTFVITSQLGALSNDGHCKTFDKSANGYVKGEGVVALLLKPLAHAERDKDAIYGIIKASVVNHGGKAQSLTAPNALVQSQLLMKAYTQANIDPSSVTYIETHGTGTELGDPIEVEGLKNAFKNLLKEPVLNAFCGLGSVKTNIGHLEPASGIAGIVKVLLSMKHGMIPGNLHFNELNSYIDLTNSPFYVVDKLKIWENLHDKQGNVIPRRAGVSSFGFGGTCAHIVLEEVAQKRVLNIPHKPYYVITLSAKQELSLKQKISDLYQWLKTNAASIDLESLSYTLNAGRAHFDKRCAIIVKSLEELSNTLQLLISGDKPHNCYMTSEKINQTERLLFDELYHSAIEIDKNKEIITPQTYFDKLCLLADLYTKQYPIDWNVIHLGENKNKLTGLPSYPFIKERYWYDLELENTKKTSVIPFVQPNTEINYENFALQYLQNIFAEKLRIPSETIDVDTTYEVYGVDSLIGLEITNRLEEDFGTLPKTLLYERSYIRDLGSYLTKKYRQQWQKLAVQNDQAEAITVSHPIGSSQPKETLPVRITDSLINQKEDIAIIGLSGIFPMAKDIDELWENLLQGRDCISEVPSERWNYLDYPVAVGGIEKHFKHGGFIPDIDKFDPLFFGISPRDANLMDPQERLFLQTTWATLEDAGYTREKLQRKADNQVGVFAGVTYNFYPLFIAEEWAKGNRLPLDIQLFSIANRISYFLNLKGPSLVIDTACSSSLTAIHLACESIQNRECRMAIAGGVNLTLHPSKYHFLGSYSFMSDQGRCASFAEGGAGYVPSEGVGAVLLKSLSDAVRDNDRIYGVIKSTSMNHGGKTSGYTVPNPNAQSEVIKAALQKASIDPRSISYIEAHGTGTALGDPIEIRGLQDAFEQFTQDKQYCAIGSVKSNIGHLESAAGISQLTKVLLQMHHKKLVPSIHADKLNPFIDFAQTPFFVQREVSDWLPASGYPRRAGISSFGAGGANVHIIIDEYVIEPLKIQPNKINKPFIFLLSAMNAERLQVHAQQILNYLSAEQHHYQTAADLDIWLNNLCYTLQTGRESMSARLAIAALDTTDLITKLTTYLSETSPSVDQLWINTASKFNQPGQEIVSELFKQEQLAKLAELWVNGAKINWELCYTDQTPKIITLPNYPFAKRRCWVPVSASSQAEEKSITEKTITNQIIEPEKRDHWLIFSDKELGFILQDELGKSSCLYCFAGREFQQQDNNLFYINPERFDDYYKLLLQIYEDNHANLQGIIYLWTLPEENKEFNGVYHLDHLFQAVIQHKWQNQLQFCLVLRGSQSLTEVFARDYGKHQVLLLDLDSKKDLRADAKNIIQEIKRFRHEENHITYKDGNRHVNPRWETPEAAIIEAINHPVVRPSFDKDYVAGLVVNSLSQLLDMAIIEIDPEVPFQNYGLDSIIGINFVAQINEHFPAALSPMDLYRYSTVNALVAYLCRADETVEPLTTSNNTVMIDNEEKFLEDIAHLDDDEISKLLEKELTDIDELR
ncbi:MAG: beta-ketoacyl synthase N-terminal-like domain-containing protein [Gammaproteobacteria bacterium]